MARTQTNQQPRLMLSNTLNRRSLLTRAGALGIAAPAAGLVAARPSGSSALAVAPSAQETPSGGTAVVSHYALFGDLDPGQLPDFAGWMIQQNVCEALVAMTLLDTGEIEIQPSLATSYESSEDGTTWTFQLRDGVTFHDGAPLNAEAVVFSHLRVMDQEHPYYRDAFAGLSTALNAIIDDVEAIDELTVGFTLKSPPSPYFLNWESFTRIVSPDAVEQHGEEFGSNIVGTGPFMLESFDFAARHVEIVRNPSYWEPELPRLDRVVWRVADEPTARLAQLETGDADVATIMPPELAERIADHPDLELHSADVPNFNMIGFHRSVPPFDNPLVRQAVAYALDRDVLASVLYAGQWSAADNNRWPGMPGWEDYAPYPHDPEQARELLAEAGHNADEEIVLDMPSSSSGNPAGQRWGELILEQLRAVGLNVQLNVLDAGSFWPLINEPRPNTMFFMTRQVIVGDVVNEWLVTFAEADQWVDESVAGLQELYADLQAAADPDEYEAIVNQMWRVVDDELPYVAIARGSWQTGLRTALRDIEPQGIGEYLLFKQASLDD